MIKIHDQYYDITNFLDKHPGGSKILESCIGIDATASFESYHALSDFQRIHTIMKKYQTKPPTEPKDLIESAKYTFTTNDFYSDVKLKVNEYFKTNNKSTKWTWIWLLYFVVTFMIYVFSFLYTFLATSQSLTSRCLSSFIAGTFLLCWMLQGYHDASHAAITKNKTVNETISLLGSAFAFWDFSTWMKHHCVLHHSFTGDYKLDPDMKHTHPYFKKSTESKANLVQKRSLITIILTFFPGMYVGHVLSYMIAQFRKRIWGFTILPTKTSIEWCIILLQIGCMIYGKSILLVIVFFTALNINYAIAILPDHDQLETRLNDKEDVTDWGEVQVRHSGNFATDNLLYTRLYGGINYQIEHHLFPSMCSYHLPAISKIVQEQCLKHEIKYINNPTIIGAYMSAIQNLSLINE